MERFRSTELKTAPANIAPAEWEMVQNQIVVRKIRGNHHNSLSPFSAKLVCGDCGGFFSSKVWHSTDQYHRVIRQCNGKFKGENKCRTPHIDEETIKKLFCTAVSELLSEMMHRLIEENAGGKISVAD